jgi:hypothetical protein
MCHQGGYGKKEESSARNGISFHLHHLWVPGSVLVNPADIQKIVGTYLSYYVLSLFTIILFYDDVGSINVVISSVGCLKMNTVVVKRIHVGVSVTLHNGIRCREQPLRTLRPVVIQ